MNPFSFGQQLGVRMKTAGMYDNIMTTGGQMLNNGARAFKGITGAVGSGLGHVGSGIAAGGMMLANDASAAFGGKPVFSGQTVGTARNTAGNFASAAKGFGQDAATSFGLGAQGMAGTQQAGSAADAAWKNLEQAPGVSDFARDLSGRARNVVNTTANIAPAAVAGQVGGATFGAAGKALKPLQTFVGGAQRAISSAPSYISRLTGGARSLLNTARTMHRGYGVASDLNSVGDIVQSGLSVPH